jgi:hypothetical protein
MRATCPVHLIILALITLTTLGECRNKKSTHLSQDGFNQLISKIYNYIFLPSVFTG